MQVPVYNLTGEVVKNIEISDHVFGVPLMRQWYIRRWSGSRPMPVRGQPAPRPGARLLAAATNCFAQKHTGRARAGDIRSPSAPEGRHYFRSQAERLPAGYAQEDAPVGSEMCPISKAGDGELKVLEQLISKSPRLRRWCRY